MDVLRELDRDYLLLRGRLLKLLQAQEDKQAELRNSNTADEIVRIANGHGPAVRLSGADADESPSPSRYGYGNGYASGDWDSDRESVLRRESITAGADTDTATDTARSYSASSDRESLDRSSLRPRSSYWPPRAASNYYQKP
jgi:hypothetical protein